MNKKIINIAGYVLIAVSFVFLVKRFASMDVEWDALISPSTLLILAVVPFLNVIVIFLNSFCWGRSLALFASYRISNGSVFAVYAESNMAKYLPGNVGHYAARQMFASQLGLRQAHIAIASVLEVGYSSCAMLALSLLFSADAVLGLLRGWFNGRTLAWIGVFAAVLFIALLAAGYVLRGNQYVAEIIKLAAEPRFWITMAGSFLLFVASTFVISAVFVLIICQYVAVGFEEAFLLAGGCTASYLIGFITPGVPGGMGVREAAMLLLLAPFFPEDKILLAAVIQRMTMIIGDVIVFPISRLFKD